MNVVALENPNCSHRHRPKLLVVLPNRIVPGRFKIVLAHLYLKPNHSGVQLPKRMNLLSLPYLCSSNCLKSPCVLSQEEIRVVLIFSLPVPKCLPINLQSPC